MIIQRYFEKPALYMNRKFDVRAFMIILCSKPWFVISNPGYVRVCLTDFTMANFGQKKVNENTGKLDGIYLRLIHETSLKV